MSHFSFVYFSINITVLNDRGQHKSRKIHIHYQDIKPGHFYVAEWRSLSVWAHCLQREKPSEEVDRRMKTWVMDADTGGGMTEGERGMREGGATTVGDMPQIMNQSVSDALETERRSGQERDRRRERQKERGHPWVHVSRAAKMSDTKGVSSVEVPEGKLVKKVSGCHAKIWVCSVLNP